ncbi:hypothetical protein CMV_007038 [Castanea mollissima]|uniref:Uncharacterized protein n=1 Tax=Castanea mollissima TaxID=60419 RepID=A0A8J4VQM0_9ROSI|nr:hypothetical protein CMV_007038 [Castanea mollissima]
MDSKEGTQQPHLVLAHKLFLLGHPDVQDIEKVRLKDEVIAAIKFDDNSSSPPIPQRFSPSHSSDSNSHFFFCFCFCVDMAPLYKTLVVVVDSVLERERGQRRLRT